ncbi:MAG: hypothetical protein AAB781_00695 [Patescibacteria group bacterium]
MVAVDGLKTTTLELPEDGISKKVEGQNRIGDNKKPPDFICRICGSREFKEKSENNGIISPKGRIWGGRSGRVYCICTGCSVIFENPEKFSKK